MQESTHLLYQIHDKKNNNYDFTNIRATQSQYSKFRNFYFGNLRFPKFLIWTKNSTETGWIRINK